MRLLKCKTVKFPKKGKNKTFSEILLNCYLNIESLRVNRRSN